MFIPEMNVTEYLLANFTMELWRLSFAQVKNVSRRDITSSALLISYRQRKRKRYPYVLDFYFMTFLTPFIDIWNIGDMLRCYFLSLFTYPGAPTRDFMVWWKFLPKCNIGGNVFCAPTLRTLRRRFFNEKLLFQLLARSNLIWCHWVITYVSTTGAPVEVIDDLRLIVYLLNLLLLQQESNVRINS